MNLDVKSQSLDLDHELSREYSHRQESKIHLPTIYNQQIKIKTFDKAKKQRSLEKKRQKFHKIYVENTDQFKLEIHKKFDLCKYDTPILNTTIDPREVLI